MTKLLNWTDVAVRGGGRGVLVVVIWLAVPSPAWAGPPFVTDDPEPVDFEHYEINIAAIGNFAQGGRSGGLPSIDFNYGVRPDVQLHFTIANDFEKAGRSATRYGYGDTELGVKYRFIDEDEDGWWPQVALYPFLEIPTGSRTAQFGTGELRTYLPIWIQKSFGPWTSYGGGGYWINPSNSVTPERNYWFAGWTLMRRIDDRWNLGGEIFWQSINGEIAGTGTGFNLGGEYDITETYHILFSAGRNLEDPTKFNAFSAYLGLQLVL
ncbi:MAG: hypothetical protein QOJ54_1431 [Aliidongia sp.]|nr:hypothetical protein [Aliidongia sp.]